MHSWWEMITEWQPLGVVFLHRAQLWMSGDGHKAPLYGILVIYMKSSIDQSAASLLCDAKHTRDIFQLSWKPYSQELCSWDTSFSNGKINIDYTFHLCFTPLMPNIEVKNFLAACLCLISVHWMSWCHKGSSCIWSYADHQSLPTYLFICLFIYC